MIRTRKSTSGKVVYTGSKADMDRVVATTRATLYKQLGKDLGEQAFRRLPAREVLSDHART